MEINLQLKLSISTGDIARPDEYYLRNVLGYFCQLSFGNFYVSFGLKNLLVTFVFEAGVIDRDPFGQVERIGKESRSHSPALQYYFHSRRFIQDGGVRSE